MIKDVIIPKVESVRLEFNLMNCLKNWFVGLADKCECESEKDSVRLLVCR
jgi:hypothetical protein